MERPRRERFSSDDGLVTLMIAIRGPDFSTMETTTSDLQLARQLGLRVTMHIGGGLHGGRMRSIQRMHEAGLLGPDMTFVHCNCCSDYELQLMVEAGGTASVSARVEMQMGHGMPATGRLVAAGVRPSLSVDVVTAVGVNMSDEMRTALQMERALENRSAMDQDQQVPELSLKARDALEFATIEGARACGLDDRVGSITPGKQADLVLLRRDAPNLMPLNDPTGSVVQAAGPANVDTIFVAGRLVKQNGKLIYCDRDNVFWLATETRNHLFAEAGTPIGALPVDFALSPELNLQKCAVPTCLDARRGSSPRRWGMGMTCSSHVMSPTPTSMHAEIYPHTGGGGHSGMTWYQTTSPNRSSDMSSPRVLSGDPGSLAIGETP